MPDQIQSPTATATLTARLFTTELLIWMVGVVFALGVGYAALANGTESNAESIGEIKDGQKEVVRDISQIKISISSISATQRATDRRLKRQETDIRDILNILRNPHTESR